MAKLYKTPGVYVEEISKFPPSVAPVETAIPAFIGRTEIIKDKSGLEVICDADHPPIPVRINSFLEYTNRFGGAYSESAVFSGVASPTITDISDSAIVKRNIIAKTDAAAVSGCYMYYALQLFFANGGGPCYIVSSGLYATSFDDKSGMACLNAIEKEDEPTILIFTDKHNVQSNTESGYALLYNAALALCNKLKDRIAIFDPWVFSAEKSVSKDIAIMRQEFGSDINTLKYGCAYYPWLKSTINYSYDEHTILINHYKDGITGAYHGLTLAVLKDTDRNTYLAVKAEMDKNTIDLPPSGAVAGIMAMVDQTRGVWKAPANVSINLVKSATLEIKTVEQDSLNVDLVSGKSINAIRSFVGKGVLVWGSRSFAGNDNEWRYISVRRFCNFVEESIKKSTTAYIFEPNDANTWVRVKGMCDNYLTTLWRQGALQGVKPEQSFFVNVGLNKTMTALDILEGRMIVEIGLAVTRPSEFIILKFLHKMQQS
jgi:phage tail sheath protein FI